MSKLKTVFFAVFLCVMAFAFAVALSPGGDDTPRMSRQQALTGQWPVPSNPPTPEAGSKKGQLLREDFSAATFPPTGWDTLNLNAGCGWFLGTYSGGGTQAALVTWDATDPVTLQDE